MYEYKVDTRKRALSTIMCELQSASARHELEVILIISILIILSIGQRPWPLRIYGKGSDNLRGAHVQVQMYSVLYPSNNFRSE